MPVKIRLMRIGTNKRPFYRVVAVDERRKRTGGYLELLGTYNPLTEPKEIKLSQDRIDDWIKKGAQMSDGFLRIIGKAPQRPPRKPKRPSKEGKKEKEEEKSAVSSQQSAEAAKEPAETKTEENPVETAAEAPVEEQTPAQPEEAASAEQPAEEEKPASEEPK